jgi:hypothetical protein
MLLLINKGGSRQKAGGSSFYFATANSASNSSDGHHGVSPTAIMRSSVGSLATSSSTSVVGFNHANSTSVVDDQSNHPFPAASRRGSAS